MYKQPTKRHASPSRAPFILCSCETKISRSWPLPLRWIICIQNMMSKLWSTVWDPARTVPWAAWWPLQCQRCDPVGVLSMATPELVSHAVNKWPGNTSSHSALPETHSSGPGSTVVHKVVTKMLKVAMERNKPFGFPLDHLPQDLSSIYAIAF